MREVRDLARRGALGFAAVAAVAAPALALAVPELEALARLEKGRWEVREAAGGPSRSVCVGDPVRLVQLEHDGLACTHEVLANAAGEGTVQYSCPGHGYGHSRIRIETPRLARIDTQGILDGRPFAYRAEARKTGPC